MSRPYDQNLTPVSTTLINSYEVIIKRARGAKIYNILHGGRSYTEEELENFEEFGLELQVVCNNISLNVDNSLEQEGIDDENLISVSITDYS